MPNFPNINSGLLIQNTKKLTVEALMTAPPKPTKVPAVKYLFATAVLVASTKHIPCVSVLSKNIFIHSIFSIFPSHSAIIMYNVIPITMTKYVIVDVLGIINSKRLKE